MSDKWDELREYARGLAADAPPLSAEQVAAAARIYAGTTTTQDSAA